MTWNHMNSNMTAFKTLTDEISDQFLACKLCQETYRRPKTLSCLHTFCTSCLEAHLEAEEERTNYRFVIYSRSLTCPVCQQRTEVPSGGVKNLPDNFLVSNLTEVVNRSKPSSSRPVCDICSNYKKRSRDAVSKCLECSKFLCAICVELHKKTKVTKSHTIFDVEVEKNIMCKCHDDEPVRFFCQPCETCICVVCTFQEHMGHEVSSFGDGIMKYVGNVQAMLKTAKHKMTSVQRHLDVVTKCEDTIAQVEERVNKLSSAFLAEIRKQQKQVIDEIRQFYGSEALEILDNKDELEQIMSTLKSTCGLAELILQNRNVELLLLHKEVKDKMKSLVNVDLPDLPDSMEKEITFVEGSMSLGFLDTGYKPVSGTGLPCQPPGGKNEKDHRDACTMTFKSTKDRGMCTDPFMQRVPTGHFDNHSSGNSTRDIDSSSPDLMVRSQETDSSMDEDIGRLRSILERRDSLFDDFKDDEKFFKEEEDREIIVDVGDMSTSTILEVDEPESADGAVGPGGDDVYDRTSDVYNITSDVHDSNSDVVCSNADWMTNGANNDGSLASGSMDPGDHRNTTEDVVEICEQNAKDVDNVDHCEITFEVEHIECETVQVEESCPNVPPFKSECCDAATNTEAEILQQYSELCLESDGGQTLSALESGASLDTQTMAEFNVQRLSAGNFTADMFRGRRSQDQEGPWQIIQDINQLPVQTEDKGINVPDVMECDSNLEIEFIDVMLRDSCTSTDIVDKQDQQTMTDCDETAEEVTKERTEDEKDANRPTDTAGEKSIIRSNSIELFTQTISDTLAITAEARQGLLELADGFYDIKDLGEFTLIETENAITPDGTILFSKTVQLADQSTETDEVKVEMAEVSCGVEVPMQDEGTEAKAEMVESATSPEIVEYNNLGTQTIAAVMAECDTMTDSPAVTDTAMATDAPQMTDTNCGPDYQSYSTTATETTAPQLVDQATEHTIEIRDTGCGDSIVTVQNTDTMAKPEMVDSSCSPEIVCFTDTCLQTDGWDFKDAYVCTDAVDVRDIFTEMPQLDLMDMFTNTSPVASVDECTSTDVTEFEDQGTGTDVISTSAIGTLTDLLRMCDATVETSPPETAEAATTASISPENSTKETMTPLLSTRDVASNARFRRKRPARADMGTGPDSIDLIDSATDTYTETSSIGLSVSPETRDDSTETVQLCYVEAGIEAAPDLVDCGTHAPTLNLCDSSTDPITPQQVDVGINTYIISLAPRKRDASTTTARTMEEISQELESVVLRGAIGGADETKEDEGPKQPDVDSELLGQKISELFSLSKLQSLTEKLAQDRRRMEEQRARKHVLPTARMLEKRLSIDDSQPVMIKRRLSGQKSVDLADDDKVSGKDTVLPAPLEQPVFIEPPRKIRPVIPSLLSLPKVSELDSRSALSLTDITPAESSLEVTPGVSPCITPSGDNLSSFSDAVEPIREKKRKHKKEKKKSKEKEREEEARRRREGLEASGMASASATTPDEDHPKKEKHKKSLFSLGRFSKSMPTLARLDEKIDRFFGKSSSSRESTPCTTPKASRTGSLDRRIHHRKAKAPKVAALLEQTILEKIKSSNSDEESGPTEEDVDRALAKESNV